MEMEEEMEGGFIFRHLQKGIRETDRRRNGQYLQVLEEEVETFLFLPPQNEKSPHRTPPTPAPSEDRLFTDWNSIRMGSPLVRTPPQSVLIRERGQDINQPTAQTTQPGSEPAQIGVAENALQEDPIVSSPRT